MSADDPARASMQKVDASSTGELAASSTQEVTTETSAVWSNHVRAPGTPEGFTVRTAYPANPDGVEVMLERWEPGTEEPPHSHPGDDMTVVVEGKMAVQFYRREEGALVADGAPHVLGKGDVGYVRAGRIHDARYVDACRLVYAHDGAFAFRPAEINGDRLGG